MKIDGSALLFAPRNLQVADTQSTQPQDRTPQVRTQSGGEAMAAFTEEMYARISQSAYDNQGEEKDPNTVVNALDDGMDWLSQRFGQGTATAAMGMVMASTQAGASEESISDGMLRTLQMLDANFGIAAGDQAMARFNGSSSGSLNNALNEFYDNGLNERFLAVAQDGSITDGMSLLGDNLVLKRNFARQAMDQSASQSSGDSPDPTGKLMEALLEDLEASELDETGLEETGLETTGLEESGLEQTQAQFMDQNMDQTMDQYRALQQRQAQAAYGWMPAPQADVLNMTV